MPFRAIRRVRQTPYVTDDEQRAWLFFSQLTIDLQVGQGTVTGQGSDPQLMLQWSDDRGGTWSSEHWVSTGKIGQYKRRAIFRRLGRSRNRVFRIVVTDPVFTAIADAFLEVDQGTS